MDEDGLRSINNMTPLFSDPRGLKIRKADLRTRPDNRKYILPLKAPKGLNDPVIVDTFATFQERFNVFTSNMLKDINWENVFAAGGSVLAALQLVGENKSDCRGDDLRGVDVPTTKAIRQAM
ncbi:MAG: hypothetical protein Q9179_007216 [Wetmoreana sp. 5 TL-2023]